jgi:hypothetical protein
MSRCGKPRWVGTDSRCRPAEVSFRRDSLNATSPACARTARKVVRPALCSCARARRRYRLLDSRGLQLTTNQSRATSGVRSLRSSACRRFRSLSLRCVYPRTRHRSGGLSQPCPFSSVRDGSCGVRHLNARACDRRARRQVSTSAQRCIALRGLYRNRADSCGGRVRSGHRLFRALRVDGAST